jgi:DNA repair protein RecO (recombination protein O)
VGNRYAFLEISLMTQLNTEGIVLQATPHQDRHHLITIFTPASGLLRLFVRGSHRSRRYSHAIVTPLTRAEFVYASRQQGLPYLYDATVIDVHDTLRSDYQHLQLACQLLQIISQSQMPSKPAPALYQLLLMYLAYIPQMRDPQAFLSSFLLKILKHEGLLAARAHCSHCENSLDNGGYLSRGEITCRQHADAYAFELTGDELLQLYQLMSIRRLVAIESLAVPPSLQNKIKQLFDALLI